MERAPIAVCQLAGVPNDLEESVAAHVRLARRAVEAGARLALFPELSLTGYHLDYAPSDALEPADRQLVPLAELAAEAGITLVVGAPLAAPDGLHIGTIHWSPATAPTTYAKRFLGGDEPATFVPGTGGATLALGDGAPVAVAICADITHPEHACDAAASGAAVYAASCLLSAAAYDAESNLLAGYAREHGMLVALANYAPPVPDWIPAGKSAIWDETGRLLEAAPAEGEAVVVATRHGDGWTAALV